VANADPAAPTASLGSLSASPIVPSAAPAITGESEVLEQIGFMRITVDSSTSVHPNRGKFTRMRVLPRTLARGGIPSSAGDPTPFWYRLQQNRYWTHRIVVAKFHGELHLPSPRAPSMLLPEIIFLSPHAYERMNAALLTPDTEPGAHRGRLDAAQRATHRRTVGAVTRGVRRIVKRALRMSLHFRAPRSAAR